MKRWLVLALALALTLSLAACGKQDTAQTPANDETNVTDDATPDDTATPDDAAAPDDADATSDDTATPDDADAPDDTATPDDVVMGPEAPDAGLANPFTDYATYAEAETAAGFKFGVPEEIGAYNKVSYRVADNASLFEVIYSNDGNGAALTARKAPGNWNISGDYSQYTQEVAQSLQGVNVTCLGDGESLFLAMWAVDDYSYSLGASASMDRMDFLGAVETIISLNT